LITSDPSLHIRTQEQNKNAEAPRILEVHTAGEGVWQQLNQQEQKQTCGSSKKLKQQKNIEDYIPS